MFYSLGSKSLAGLFSSLSETSLPVLAREGTGEGTDDPPGQITAGFFAFLSFFTLGGVKCVSS